MQVFFDTEFTSLDANRMRGLISVGLVAQDGRKFYAELSDTWDDSMCSLFVLDTVIPLLEGGEHVVGVEMLAVHLKDWIEGLGLASYTANCPTPINYPIAAISSGKLSCRTCKVVMRA